MTNLRVPRSGLRCGNTFGMAQDLAATGVELPALMTAGRCKSSRMPARYTERQAGPGGQVLPRETRLGQLDPS